MKQVAAVTFLALVENASAQATVFVLRPEAAVAADGLPGARALSLAALQAGDLPDVPQDEPVYLVCERGAVSELAGLYLEAAGFSEVYSLTGGLKAYRALLAFSSEV